MRADELMTTLAGALIVFATWLAVPPARRPRTVVTPHSRRRDPSR